MKGTNYGDIVCLVLYMILTCKINNLEMDYFKYGNGDKTIVMIPGVSIKSVMESEKIVADAYKIFNDEFTTYVFDRKKNMPKDYSINDMALDMIKVIEELGLNDIYLLGASQGGMIASIIAYQRPDLVKKLSINSITAKVSNKEYLLFDEIIKLSKNNKLNEMVNLLFSKVYSNELCDSIKDSLQPFIDSISKEDIERFIIECEALYNFDILDNLKNIKCETLIIAGKNDLIFDYNNSLIINQNIRNSKIYIYDSYGHALYDEAPDFKERVYKFLLSNE